MGNEDFRLLAEALTREYQVPGRVTTPADPLADSLPIPSFPGPCQLSLSPERIPSAPLEEQQLHLQGLKWPRVAASQKASQRVEGLAPHCGKWWGRLFSA